MRDSRGTCPGARLSWHLCGAVLIRKPVHMSALTKPGAFSLSLIVSPSSVPACWHVMARSIQRTRMLRPVKVRAPAHSLAVIICHLHIARARARTRARAAHAHAHTQAGENVNCAPML